MLNRLVQVRVRITRHVLFIAQAGYIENIAYLWMFEKSEEGRVLQLNKYFKCWILKYSLFIIYSDNILEQ